MAPEFAAEKKPMLPSVHPELKNAIPRKYQELRDRGYGITESTDIVGRSLGGLSRSTVRYWAIASVKEKEIKSRTDYSRNQRETPDGREKYNARMAPYNRARRNILRHIYNVYARAPPETSLSLFDLSDELERETSFRFRPPTLEGLVTKLSKKHEIPLLIKHSEYDPPRYSLNQSQTPPY